MKPSLTETVLVMASQALLFSTARELYTPPDLNRAWPRHHALPDDLLGEEVALLLLRYGTHIVVERRDICEKTLRRAFLKRGTRLNDHLRRVRRDLALRLLGTHLPIATVAIRLGFASSQTFARFVRREFSSTATEVRLRLQD